MFTLITGCLAVTAVICCRPSIKPDLFINGEFWDPKPQILGLFDMSKTFSPVFPSLCWLFPRPHPFDTSHFLIKRKEYFRDLCSTVRQRQREIVFVSNCHVDETRVHGAVRYSTPSDSEKGKRGPWWNLLRLGSVPKKPHRYYLPLLSLACALPSRPLSNNLCVTEQARFHSSSCTIFHLKQESKKKKKAETSERDGKRQTNQFERPDKCNKPKVYFSAPSKWVLRYCITLFM